MKLQLCQEIIIYLFCMKHNFICLKSKLLPSCNINVLQYSTNVYFVKNKIPKTVLLWSAFPLISFQFRPYFNLIPKKIRDSRGTPSIYRMVITIRKCV